MFSKILVLSLLLAVSAAATTNLTRSISLRAGNNYEVPPVSATFVQAWAYCRNQGRQFVALPTEADNDYLAASLAGTYDSVSLWVGGIYLQFGITQKWYWVDENQAATYTNWKSKAPSISTTNTVNYCILYNFNSVSKTGNWTYARCDAVHPFVCQIL